VRSTEGAPPERRVALDCGLPREQLGIINMSQSISYVQK